MNHDLSLNSGERQVATEYSAVRADHRFRYEWAEARIPAGGFGLDVFCGNGYGTWLLSQRRVVVGIDGSVDAIRQAELHYRTPRTFFAAQYYPFELPVGAFDFVVALESLEHVEDGPGFFGRLTNSLRSGGSLIFSTPCEERLPHASTGNHFHFRHYTLQETFAISNSAGLQLVDWAGQDTYSFLPDGRQGGLLPAEQMQLNQRAPGQFLILHSRKAG